jgi:hypothetical protein
MRKNEYDKIVNKVENDGRNRKANKQALLKKNIMN